MGIITRMFRRNLSEQEKEEKSRREKEWAQKCYNKGEQFAERISLDKYIGKINDFANKYPRTFFISLFGLIIASIMLNSLVSLPSQNVGETIQQLQQTSMMQSGKNPTSSLAAQLFQMAEDLKEIDSKIAGYMAKDSLTHQDSLDVKSLLLQARAIQQVIEGASDINSDTITTVNP